MEKGGTGAGAQRPKPASTKSQPLRALPRVQVDPPRFQRLVQLPSQIFVEAPQRVSGTEDQVHLAALALVSYKAFPGSYLVHTQVG